MSKAEKSLILVILAASFALLAFAFAGCTAATPLPMEPEAPEPSPAEPQEPEEEAAPTPEDIFNAEFDACWATRVMCLKTNTDKVCWPPHEACVVAAYRKLLKARKDQKIEAEKA